MPSTTPKQHRAMEAAKHGNSTLGIPQSVGEEFANADEAKARNGTAKNLQAHGLARGDGSHKRHPSTDHFKMRLKHR